MIPTNPDTLLVRDDTAEALTEAGFPTARGTLQNAAHRGDGPPYSIYGRRALYRWGDALEWARNRSPVHRSAAEHEQARAKQRPRGRPRKVVAASSEATP
jgi:hypothetical protein